MAGGASGQGLLIAEFYGMRGVSVAVLDVKPEEEVDEGFQELPAVEYYRCDVGDRGEVEAVAARITKDVGFDISHASCFLLVLYDVWGYHLAWFVYSFGGVGNQQ